MLNNTSLLIRVAAFLDATHCNNLLECFQLPSLGDCTLNTNDVLQPLLSQKRAYNEKLLHLAAATLPDAIPPSRSPLPYDRAIVSGRRGAPGHYKGNTLESYHTAIDQGAHMIEVDISLLRDGGMIVLHDLTLSDGRYISDCTKAEIRAYDPDILTLSQVMTDEKICRSGVKLFLNVKAHNAAEILMRYLSVICSSMWEPSRIVIGALNQHVLLEAMAWRNVLGHLDDLTFAAIMDGGAVDLCLSFSRLGVSWVNISTELLTREFMEDAHKRGIKVMCWTVNTERQMCKMLELGVDAISTEFPDTAVRMIAAFDYADMGMPAMMTASDMSQGLTACNSPTSLNPQQQLAVVRNDKRTAIVMSHRGGRSYAKDNTMDAFHKAVEMKAHMIETDVNILNNRQLVLYHDITTNFGQQFVRDTAPEEALQYMVTLRQLFEDDIIRNSNINIYLDLKQLDYNEELVAELAGICVQCGWDASRIMIASFDQRQIREIGRLRAQYEVLATMKLGVILDAVPIDYCESLSHLGLSWISMEKGNINPAFVNDAHARGIQVAAWTVNQTTSMRRLAMIGVSGLCTDSTALAHGFRSYTFTTLAINKYGNQPANLRNALQQTDEFYALLKDTGLSITEKLALPPVDIPVNTVIKPVAFVPIAAVVS